MPLHKYMIEHLLYPAMEQHKGNQIRAILNELQLSQKANAPAVQYQRLIKLLLHCKQHVPAYAGLLPDDSVILTDPMAVLRTRIPLLPKTNFQQNPEAYLADDIPASSRIANCTGGSTGQPVHFYMTRHQVESYEAARWRGLSWYGITQGSRSVMLWGSPIELSKQAQLKNRLKESLLKNRRILSAYNLTEQDLTKHVRFLEHYRPEYLYGYATILTAFAQMLENAHITPNLSLKAVVSTSETLEKWQEELLSRVFRCPVANEYGARDAGILAYTCPDGGIHDTRAGAGRYERYSCHHRSDQLCSAASALSSWRHGNALPCFLSVRPQPSASDTYRRARGRPADRLERYTGSRQCDRSAPAPAGRSARFPVPSA